VRVLFVKQDHCSPSGLIGDGFAVAGWDVSELVVVPEARYHSPDVALTFPPAGEFDAVVFFGAAWAVYDTATIPWVSAEIAYARDLIARGVPTLGICFGGQMLAAAVGGTVARAPIPEIGWVSVASAEPALIDSGPWLSWHFDRFTLPPSVPVLARTALAAQAFTYGPALGLQFHPEVTESVLESWIAVDGAASLAALGIDPGALVAQARTLSRPAAARACELVRRFVTDVARRPPAPLPGQARPEMVVTPIR
jgi:GMP synthase-like glutamine amidotransferase